MEGTEEREMLWYIKQRKAGHIQGVPVLRPLQDEINCATPRVAFIASSDPEDSHFLLQGGTGVVWASLDSRSEPRGEPRR